MTDTGDTAKIDDLIAYIESPEYIRMTAFNQGENPSALLGARTPTLSITDPAPVFEPLTHGGTSTTSYSPRRRTGRRMVRGKPRWNLTTHSHWHDFRMAMDNCEEFRTSGALRGMPRGSTIGIPSGRLPGAIRLRFENAFVDVRVSYVVFSYDTPIVWLEKSQGEFHWIIPKVKYSTTTSRHQTKIVTAAVESALPHRFVGVDGIYSRRVP